MRSQPDKKCLYDKAAYLFKLFVEEVFIIILHNITAT